MVIEISQLNFYPIKSCRGTTLDTAEVGLRGLLHDREWLIVNAELNNMITQREVAKMCLINPEILADENALKLSAPGVDSILVPITKSPGSVASRSGRKPVALTIKGMK